MRLFWVKQPADGPARYLGNGGEVHRILYDVIIILDELLVHRVHEWPRLQVHMDIDYDSE